MSNSILNTVVNAVKAIVTFVIIANFKVKMIVSKFSRDSYPEIRKYCTGNIITTQAVKAFLYDNGLLSLHDYQDPKCDYQPIAYGLYLAFCKGLLSLNATKQTGVLNNTPIRVSTSMGGKMKDVWAISTLSLVNPMCLRRMRISGIVCEHCYVKRSLHITAILNYVQNFFVLSSGPLATEFIPVLNPKSVKNHPLVRLESMGDLANSIQAENYLRIASANEAAGFRFALWTKNPNYLKQAIDSYGKPENLSTVWSMSRVNVMDPNSDKWNKYFDHRFIVVDGQELKDSFIAKNGFYPCKCGKRSCITCQECYTRRNSVETAVELLRK